ncbi:hypothetical protein ThidrDRAFT_2831 [Thiorhodococcus drewsii AZ1]|uniref:Uncharacterized protein n=1 Tax=Thiorhodococcus drewsii AZ1 TaxID=765913 RepID=G2E3G8_9GAMM|nr:hypothetical protein [Thiorhodococcus drewsii]EGV30357.1 hypothetical protein ThidrDRAFT_2831 [Thiorhodococcus drewsii AZ1]
MARAYLIENNPRSLLFYSVGAKVGPGKANYGKVRGSRRPARTSPGMHSS